MIVTPTSPPQPAQTVNTVVNAPATSSFWNDTGKVAGTFVALALVIVGIAAAAIFFGLRCRRNRNEQLTVASNADEDQVSTSGKQLMTDRRRSNLTLASAGMVGLTHGSSNEKSPEHTPVTLSRRPSIPLVHDQRLNPAALWNSAHENGSHVSVASFRDDRDYTRPVLHVGDMFDFGRQMLMWCRYETQTWRNDIHPKPLLCSPYNSRSLTYISHLAS